MEVASAAGIRTEYPAIALRTRGRSHERAACHSPGCRNRAASGRKFCELCQARLDRVRTQLKAAGARGRKPSIGRGRPARNAA